MVLVLESRCKGGIVPFCHGYGVGLKKGRGRAFRVSSSSSFSALTLMVGWQEGQKTHTTYPKGSLPEEVEDEDLKGGELLTQLHLE